MSRLSGAIKKMLFLFFAFVLSFSIFSINASSAYADTANFAKVSFTFDDAYQSSITKAAPTLAKYGFSGTNYVPTACVGTTGTCPADEQGVYMTWSEIHALKNTYGWEIGAHTNSHQPMTTLGANQKLKQITQSQSAFNAQGIYPTAFASPEGDYDPATLALLSKYYTSHRGFHDTGYNVFPYNDYILRVQQVQVGVSVDQVKAYIDYARDNGVWLILVFHDIQDSPNLDPNEYEYSTADLDAIANYVKQANVPVKNVSEGIISSSTNLLPNGDFASGLSAGWTTDSTTNVKINTASNGRIPNVANSVRLTGNATKNVHLFSPKTYVNSGDTYAIKSYVKITQRTSGDITYYIDEYDSLGNWVSGQYKANVSWLFPEEKSFAYIPTSTNVKSARLQLVVPKASVLTAFVDNFEWFSTTGTPVTPPPAPTNIMPNSTFESGMNGWATDSPAQVTQDNTGRGEPTNPQNSVKLVSKSAGNSHLFSDKVAVNFGQVYQLNCYLVISQGTTGFIGFYVDEYDANGNWISGQYLAERSTLGTYQLSLNYSPTSAIVKHASFQIIVGAGNTTAYLDNILWLRQ